MRWLHFVGTALFLASLALVALFARKYWSSLESLPAITGRSLALASLCYAAAQISSALGWISGLRGIGQKIPTASGLKINMVSQVGKYVPGNVAHHIARVALASRVGVGILGGGVATALEIIGNLVAASIVAATAMAFDSRPIDAIHRALADNMALPATFTIAALVLITIFLRKVKAPVRALLSASAWLTLGLVLYGLSFYAVVAATATAPLSPIAAVGIFAIAWTVGYVVPGAPAGLGVRDAILIAWLETIIGGGSAFACVMFHRLMTTGVDALAGLAGYGWMRLGKPRRLS